MPARREVSQYERLPCLTTACGVHAAPACYTSGKVEFVKALLRDRNAFLGSIFARSKEMRSSSVGTR